MSRGGTLKDKTHCVVTLILVLGQPISDVVVDDTGVVSQSEVSILVL